MLNKSWYRLIGLTALQGAISLTWLIYNIYLPKLLVGYGFATTLVASLLIVENIIAIFLEPILGNLSDRAFRWIATKFGFVSFGVILTSAITIMIPALLVFKNTFATVTWIMPGVLIAWAMSMALFRTPAISLIGQYAMNSELPIAMSFLTLAGGLIGAVKPVSQDFLLSLGAPVAFTIASIVLLAATALLRYVDPPTPLNAVVREVKPSFPSKLGYGVLIGMGWGVAWGSRCLFETIPKILKTNLPQANAVTITVFISIAIAISAISSGMFAAKYGNRKAMLLGVIATEIALSLMVFVPAITTMVIGIILVVCCFSLITNGAIPLAIDLLPKHRIGLAVGLYFSGFNAGISSFSASFNPVTKLTPTLGATFGLIGLTVAGIFIWSSRLPEQSS
jgi:Na+/melibiose symporter-like transporter